MLFYGRHTQWSLYVPTRKQNKNVPRQFSVKIPTSQSPTPSIRTRFRDTISNTRKICNINLRFVYVYCVSTLKVLFFACFDVELTIICTNVTKLFFRTKNIIRFFFLHTGNCISFYFMYFRFVFGQKKLFLHILLGTYVCTYLSPLLLFLVNYFTFVHSIYYLISAILVRWAT